MFVLFMYVPSLKFFIFKFFSFAVYLMSHDVVHLRIKMLLAHLKQLDNSEPTRFASLLGEI